MKARKTILIADDVDISRTILQNLVAEKYETLEACDGEEAIAMLTRNAQKIALLLLDIRMPKKNGYDVLQFMQLHNLLTRIPVIVITGSESFEDELRAYDFGASDIIHKPFVSQVVLRRIDNLIELYGHRSYLEEQLEASRRIISNAKHFDPLTKLYNKQYFFEEANQILRNMEKDGNFEEYVLAFCNIKNFKLYNINYGAEAGDKVLQYLASLIQHYGGSDALHARFGSDHIISFKKNGKHFESGDVVVEIFDKEFGKNGLSLKIGYYKVQMPGMDASIACDMAKIACDSIYDSRKTYCVYDENLQKRIDTRAYVLQHFDEAMEKGYLKVYYQPVKRTLTDVLCGFEALARWIDPVIGFLTPADFIVTLEENHLITKLDLYMLRLVCRRLKWLEEHDMPLVPVSINLSRADFSDCDIFAEVEAIVKEYGIARDMINLEVTESIVTDNPVYMREIIERFRSTGYQVWMDDFGSGYSSLNILKDFRFDEIKLDMKFLSSFDDTSKKIIESVVLMSKRMGIQTLAEGVETQEQYDYLRSIGCEKAQGYLFSSPQPFEKIMEAGERDHMPVECRAVRRYYDAASAANFITDRAMALVEYNEEHFFLSVLQR